MPVQYIPSSYDYALIKKLTLIDQKILNYTISFYSIFIKKKNLIKKLFHTLCGNAIYLSFEFFDICNKCDHFHYQIHSHLKITKNCLINKVL